MRTAMVLAFGTSSCSSEPFPCQFAGKNGNPRNNATWSVETCDEAEPNRIIATQKYDRNCAGRRFNCADRRAVREDHSHPTVHQLSREWRQVFRLIVRPAMFDRNVVPLMIADFRQALPKRHRHRPVAVSGCAVEKADHRDCGLLRMRTAHQR